MIEPHTALSLLSGRLVGFSLGLIGGGYGDPAWLEEQLGAAGGAPVAG